MTLKQAYIAVYEFLSLYYEETKDDELIDLLSSMNPFLWADGDSADPAIYRDWLDLAKKVTNDKQLDAKRAYQAMIGFLKFYKKEFDYVPEWLIKDLEDEVHNMSKWLECVDTVIEVNGID